MVMWLKFKLEIVTNLCDYQQNAVSESSRPNLKMGLIMLYWVQFRRIWWQEKNFAFISFGDCSHFVFFMKSSVGHYECIVSRKHGIQLVLKPAIK